MQDGEWMRKIAVIFPGIGYTKDRPLLYFSGKQALKCGYELHFVEFSGIEWSKEKLKDRGFLLEVLEKSLKKTEEALDDLGDMSDDEVIFISKSIGTVVAAAYARKKSINPRQICFSPLEMISGFVEEDSGILFYGDKDPMADHNVIEKIAGEKHLETYRILELYSVMVQGTKMTEIVVEAGTEVFDTADIGLNCNVTEKLRIRANLDFRYENY